jgi:hypothetical protein
MLKDKNVSKSVIMVANLLLAIDTAHHYSTNAILRQHAIPTDKNASAFVIKAAVLLLATETALLYTTNAHQPTLPLLKSLWP